MQFSNSSKEQLED